MWPYVILDILFFAFHTLVIFFNLLGWIWPKTRKANLALLLTTAFSWLFLGYWKGWGYCFLVDWHWQIREKLGATGLPASFIKYCLDRLTGLDFDPVAIDIVTGAAFAIAFVCSAYVNIKSAYSLGAKRLN